MSGAIDILLTALIDHLSARHDLSAGLADEDALNDTKKRFGQSLNQYLDWRIEGAIDKRRQRQSAQRIQMADVINSTVNDTASAVRAITALSSAPPPPTSSNEEEIKRWTKAYAEWYDTARKKGVEIG